MDSFADERLLLSLLRGESGEDHKDGIVHPGSFLELCRRHRISSLIYRSGASAGRLPPETLSALRELTRKTLVDNLILLKALLDLAAALTEEGTGFVVLKGASLLGFLYPEIEQRFMSDLDLLIREKDWPKVAETLRQRGYRLPEAAEERFYRETWYHQLVETPGFPSCNVEFHWNLESVERSRIDPDELIRDAVTCELEGERFLRLCDDHLFLHLAIHLAHHYQDPSLHWVEDLRRLLRMGALDWERIHATARIWGVESCLAYSLEYVERIFPGAVPERGRRIRLSPTRRLILRSLGTRNPALPHRDLAGSPLRHALSMAMVDRWRDAARYVAVHSAARLGRAVGISKGVPPRAELPGRPRSASGDGIPGSAAPPREE
jgi:putative nucleotidyltransferase-like protein